MQTRIIVAGSRMISRALFGICVGLAFLITSARSATGETEPLAEDVRFQFTNSGPCRLVVNFAGGVATPTAFLPAGYLRR